MNEENLEDGESLLLQGVSKLLTEHTVSQRLKPNFISLIITQPTNALIVCHLFLNNFLKHFHCSYMFR